MKIMRSGFGVAMLSVAAMAAGYFGGRPLLDRIEFSRAEADVQVTRQELSTVEDLSTVFRHVGKVVEPSVVKIWVSKTVKESGTNVPEDQLRRFFEEHGQGMPPFNFNDKTPDQGLEEIGTGSGVIMDAENGYGYILTNNHVAGDASEIRVTLADGRRIAGHDVKLLGADAKGDLALVQIKADRLIPAKWGNSDELEKGDWIMAFGAPFGYVGSMTHGIVSALNRNDIMDSSKMEYENFIQVDAPINPGNSGGPLVNMHGEVVGINTAIATVSGGFQGIGFAIPSNRAKVVYTELKEHGKVVRGWLGVGIKSYSDDPDTAKYLGFTGDSGVVVEQTFPNTPATGKLQHGDVIVGLNGQPVADASQLRNHIAESAPNSTITLQVSHNGKTQDVKITLGDQPDNVAAIYGNSEGAPNAGGPANEVTQTPQIYGMTLESLDQEMAENLGLHGVKSGAVITAVAHGSDAFEAGLAKGEVITEVGRTYVHNAQEAAAALQKVDITKGVPLYVATGDGSQYVFLKGDAPPK